MNRKLAMTHDVDKFLARLDAKVFRQIDRIVYAFDSDTVYIILIGKRNDDEVYLRLNRK